MKTRYTKKPPPSRQAGGSETTTAETSLEKRFSEAALALSPRRKDLLRRILQSPDETFYLSSRQLAKYLGVDPATIVRMVQALGYERYSEFTSDLRQHFVRRITPYSVMQSVANDQKTLADHVAHSISNDLSNTSRMEAQLDLATIEAVADRIWTARRVLVVGLDLAFTMSNWLSYTLTMLGVNSDAPTDRAILKYKTQALTPDDLLIAITFRRCMKETVESVIQAKANGVPTIGITDAISNPIGRRVDHTLLASIEGPVISGSQIAPMTLLNAVAVTCANLRSDLSLEALKFTHTEYEEGGRWFVESGE